MNDLSIGRKLLWFAALFAVMFAARLTVGYRTVPDAPRAVSSRTMIPDVSSDVESARRNYATSWAEAPDGERTALATYERTASIVAASREYDRDTRRLREIIEGAGGEVQSERDVRRSDTTTRALFVSAAIPPDRLEQAIADVRAIGRTESTEITQTDRTKEHLAAASERSALEETRRALMELRRTSPGAMGDRAELERRILDVDTRLQAARLAAGTYEGPDRATMHAMIYEERDMFVAPPTFERRAMIAFKWAAKYSLALTAAMALFSIFLLLAAGALSRLSAIYGPSVRSRRHQRWSDAPQEVPAQKRLRPAPQLPEIAEESSAPAEMSEDDAKDSKEEERSE